MYVGDAHMGEQDELYCPFIDPNILNMPRIAPRLWDSQHGPAWVRWVDQRSADPNLGCERDEYPFYRMMGPPNVDPQLMRL